MGGIQLAAVNYGADLISSEHGNIIDTNKVVINYYSLFSGEVTGYFDQTTFFSLQCCA